MTALDAETLRLLARVLDYPDAGTAEDRAELVRRLGEARPEAARALEAHGRELGESSLARQREIYATTFDVNPVVCLYAGYHLFGDSYPRGAFMAHLNGTYRAVGYETGGELPDHFCEMLRFLAHVRTLEVPSADPAAELATWSDELIDDAIVPAARTIVRAFDQTSNPYGALLRAVLLTFERPGGAESGVDARRRSRSLPVLTRPDPMRCNEEWKP
ncbi:MAG: nitrate reductase molybdenum cofactor assembly chaperone [Gemmatimonadota bacterium]